MRLEIGYLSLFRNKKSKALGGGCTLLLSDTDMGGFFQPKFPTHGSVINLN